MSIKHRWKFFCIAALAMSALSSLAYASVFDAPLAWFASRPLSSQAFWDKPHIENKGVFLRQAYLMGELAASAYDKPEDRTLGKLGFTTVKNIHRSKTLDGGDMGTVIGIGVGGAIDGLTGGATLGAGSIIGGSIGRANIKKMDVDSSGFVAESLDHTLRVVSVRGTREKEIQDWMLDSNAATLVDDNGDVTYHHGFFLYAGLIYDDVRTALGDACNGGGQRVWLTGHSLGGAAAELLAFWLKRDGCNVEGVITFAAPRPGLDDLQYAYNKKLGAITHRFLNDTDPVVCLPIGEEWAEVGHQHTISYTNITFDDPHDSCTGIGGDRTVGQQIYSFLEKVHDVTDPTTTVSDWLDKEGKDLGLCGDGKLAKAIGWLTLGASKATCKTIDLTSDLVHLADMLIKLPDYLKSGHTNVDSHVPTCPYLDPLVINGWDNGSFSDPIWAQYFENTWDNPNCPKPMPPSPPPPPPSRNAQGCYGKQVCCTGLIDGKCPECVVSDNVCNL